MNESGVNREVENTSVTSSFETGAPANQDSPIVTTVKPVDVVGATLKKPSVTSTTPIEIRPTANQEASKVAMTSSVTLETTDYDYDNMELPPSLPNLE